MHRILVLASLMLTLVLLGHAVRSNPNSSIGAELAAGDMVQVLRGGFTMAVLVAIACWPWLLAFARATREGEKLPAIIFAVLSVALAAWVHSGIASAPAEGIGYYVILFVLAVWLAYPIIVRVTRNW